MKREHDVEGCEFCACLSCRIIVSVARPCVGGERERGEERKQGEREDKLVRQWGKYSGTAGFSNPN